MELLDLNLRQLIASETFDVIHTHRAAYKVLLRTCGDTELPAVVINRGHSRPVRERELQKLQHPAVRAMVVVASHGLIFQNMKVMLMLVIHNL